VWSLVEKKKKKKVETCLIYFIAFTATARVWRRHIHVCMSILHKYILTLSFFFTRPFVFVSFFFLFSCPPFFLLFSCFEDRKHISHKSRFYFGQSEICLDTSVFNNDPITGKDARKRHRMQQKKDTKRTASSALPHRPRSPGSMRDANPSQY
jgi:hypothetical protein